MAVQRLDPIQVELDRLESKMMQLKVVYEHYFLGIEKREPTQLKDEVQRMLRDFDRRIINNTGVKFRLQMLKARWISFNQYWNRIQKQIEDGNYRPHLKKAELRERLRREAEDRAREEGDGSVKRQPAANGGAAARPSGGGQQKKSAMDKLHDQYSAARARTGEGSVGKDKLATVVKKQAAAIKKKYKCRTVEFRVVIENGKTKLKAIPKN